MGEDVADFSILTLGETHLHPAIASGPSLEVRVDRAIADAVDGDSLSQLFQLLLRHLTVRPGAIGADNPRLRKLELPLQFAIVGQEQKALGHEIEPADGHQSRKT